MNEPLCAAQPPFFSETHAATIAAAAREYPDADGLLIDVHSQHMLVAASTVDGVIGRWVAESPVNICEMEERQAQLAKAGLKYICLTMHCDRLVPLDPKTSH